MSHITKAKDWLVALFQGAKAKVVGFIDKIRGHHKHKGHYSAKSFALRPGLRLTADIIDATAETADTAVSAAGSVLIAPWIAWGTAPATTSLVASLGAKWGVGLLTRFSSFLGPFGMMFGLLGLARVFPKAVSAMHAGAHKLRGIADPELDESEHLLLSAFLAVRQIDPTITEEKFMEKVLDSQLEVNRLRSAQQVFDAIVASGPDPQGAYGFTEHDEMEGADFCGCRACVSARTGVVFV